MMPDLRFAEPWMLLLIPAIIALACWSLFSRRPARPRMRYSSLELLREAGRTLRTRMLALPALLTFLACLLLALALARPQSAWRESKRFSEGIDIMLVLDVSDSMAALDFTPNRLERSKAVIKEFIKHRVDDQIGLTIFGVDTFAMSPLTHDYKALDEYVDRIHFDLVSGNGTAIGMGLANGVSQLRASKAKSKVVILLTDGENNAGQIDPISAGTIAKAFNVRVYTIGVGTEGRMVDIPDPRTGGRTLTQMPSQLNAEQLTEIAEMTGGQFFRATDDQSLEQIYAQIDTMERTRVEVAETQAFDDLGHFLIIPALGLLLLAFGLENTWLRTFP